MMRENKFTEIFINLGDVRREMKVVRRQNNLSISTDYGSPEKLTDSQKKKLYKEIEDLKSEIEKH